MRTIHCRDCDQDLPVEAFRASRVGPNTKRDVCRKCSSAAALAWNRANPERFARNQLSHRPKALARMAAWNKENRAYLTEFMRKWRDENRDSVRRIAAAGRARNAEKINAGKIERQARMRAHVPPWADLAAIKAIYSECRRLRKETGENYHVDHIIPLKGKNVCGLHVETNLQIILGIDNMRKGNRLMEAAY